MVKKGHIPERTCAFCKKKAPKFELFRFVNKGGALVFDPEKKLQGRGAYLCKECFEKRDNRKIITKLLRSLRIISS
ncbi:YlxR family protein [Thermodesulfobacterium thermophilum]|uniref:YlxR family protein n=1 Tax=Thermodesulfobacterium thermophilum TaxID=886 RepID=UPI0003B4E338|nr:DUF448 domain-containing protein [Thermodesulfobacterium thermophilum]